MQSDRPGSVGEYLQNRILYRGHRYQTFSFGDVERGFFRMRVIMNRLLGDFEPGNDLAVGID